MTSYYGRDLLAQSPITQGMSFAELHGAVTGRDTDRYLGPIEKSPPAIRTWRWWHYLLNGCGLAMVLGVIVALGSVL